MFLVTALQFFLYFDILRVFGPNLKASKTGITDL